MNTNKNREELIPAVLNSINAKTGVEVGVFRGEFSKILLESWPGTLYMIDPWRPLGDEYLDSSNHKNFYDEYTSTVENIRGLEDRGFMLRGLGEELVNMFADESLDFVYIDANHAYDYVKRDMEVWYPKLKKGGLFAGHDYLSIDWANSTEYKLCDNSKDRIINPNWGDGEYFAGIFGVNPAVDEFCKLHNKESLVTAEFWGTWYFIK